MTNPKKSGGKELIEYRWSCIKVATKEYSIGGQEVIKYKYSTIEQSKKSFKKIK